MSYMAEYIDKGLNPFQLEKELMILINRYDELTGKHLFVYSVDLNKSDMLSLYYFVIETLTKPNTNSKKERKL